jgi:hypothetical protein
MVTTSLSISASGRSLACPVTRSSGSCSCFTFQALLMLLEMVVVRRRRLLLLLLLLSLLLAPLRLYS